MNKTIYIRFGFVALILAVIVVSVNAGRPHKLTLGGLFPMTGALASYGTYCKQGAELAVDDAIRSGLIKKDDITLDIEDGAGDPAKSIAAFRAMLLKNKPVAVIPVTSGVILAMKPIANQEHVVLVNASAVSVDIEDAQDYVFSILPNANTEGAFLADFAYSQGKRNMAIILRNDASGISFANAFEKSFTKLGGKILYKESHEPKANDFRSYISKLKVDNQIDAVFVASLGPEVATFLKQAHELSFDRQAYAYTTFYSPTVLKMAGPAANGVYFSAPVFNALSEDRVAVDLRMKLIKKYNTDDTNYYVASHYDATMLILLAISKGNKSAESIKNYISNVGIYNGISGQVVFDKNGQGVIPLKMYTVKNGQFSAI